MITDSPNEKVIAFRLSEVKCWSISASEKWIETSKKKS